MADDTLMDLIDAYAEARHVGGCHTYNTKTAEARAKVVAALAAAPQGVAYAELHQRVEELIEKESELRRVVEIIALGESANPVIDAGDELVSLGYWDAGAVAALRASNGQAPAGAADEMAINRPVEDSALPFNQLRGEMQSALKRAGVYAARSPGAGNKLTLRWRATRDDVLPTPTAQAAPSAGITVEQVEDAIGLQSTAWDTIGAEKIVEAVLRLANGQAPATKQAVEVRPVTPYTCPKCHALWLHWPAEQTGFGRDTLNCRSADHCHYCEKAGVEQLQRLERIPAALHAPQPTPAAQADSVLEDAAASEVLMEHSGCGSGTQVDMLTVRLNPGDKVIMLKGRITQAIDAARKQGGL